jgi:predicted PurR-regulated permease PerM/GAF domain-containing protein
MADSPNDAGHGAEKKNPHASGNADAETGLRSRPHSPMPARDPAQDVLIAMVPALRWLTGMLIASLLIAALYVGRELLIPLVLAVLLGFLLDPAVTRLKRWGLPRMVATMVMVVVVLGSLGGLGFYLGKQIQQLSADLPRYEQTIKTKLRSLRHLTSGPSAWDGAVQTYTTVEKELDSVAQPGGRSVQRVAVVADVQKPADVLVEWIGKFSEPVAMAGIVLLFVILILLDRDDLRDRLLRLMGGNLHVATDALDEASERIGKYLRMQFIVNVTYGIPMAVGLWFIGIPGAVLWGVLATIMRFVPYVGPMISALFPLALAFAVAPGWDLFLWTLGLILVLELISNNVIEPWLYGASTGLSTLAIILSATFWTALWGPVGLILSTPMTVCLLVLGRYLPGLQFMEVLLGNEPVLEAPQRLYQRLLADDVDTAIDLAHSDIETRFPSRALPEEKAQAVAGFYGEVLLPMLRLACKHHTETATVEHRLRLSNGMDELLEELQEDYPAPEPESDERTIGRVHCVGARWEIDTLAADMVAHALRLKGLHATSAGHATVAQLDDSMGDVQWLVVSVFHPQPQSMGRWIARRVHRRYPGLRVILAAWNVPQTLLQEHEEDAMGAEHLVNSMEELLLRFDQLQSPVQGDLGQVPADLPDGDDERVRQLHASGLLDPTHELTYQEATFKAANAFDVKYAQVSLVDADWVHTPGTLLKARGQPDGRSGLARDLSICSYVVLRGEAMVVDDMARDPRFADSPSLKEAQVKFYAGVPFLGEHGEVLGALCIMDDQPRTMDKEDLETLEEMARHLAADLLHKRGGSG